MFFWLMPSVQRQIFFFFFSFNEHQNKKKHNKVCWADIWHIYSISFTCLYKLFTFLQVVFQLAVYQARDQIANKCVFVLHSTTWVPKKKKKSSWLNYISHWGVNMQTQSLICHFINITASARWPTLLFSVCVVVNKGSFVSVRCKQNVGTPTDPNGTEQVWIAVCTRQDTNRQVTMQHSCVRVI